MIMDTWTLGILAGLATAALWTVTALVFEDASKSLGSLVVNLLRLCIAAFLFVALSFFRFGSIIDPSLTNEALRWLIISGLVGFVLGDLMLFEAYVQIGSRLSMLIYALVPPFAAIIGWIFLAETMRLPTIAGMVLTLAGIGLALMWRPKLKHDPSVRIPKKRKTLADSDYQKQINTEGYHRLKGILLALGASIAQAAGIVLAKTGAPTSDSFAATQIRVFAGIAGFIVVFTLLGRWNALGRAISNMRNKSMHVASTRKAWLYTSLGAIIGPFLGVSLGLLSTQLTTTGVASTLMALVPVFIIGPSILFFGEKASPGEIAGALLAFAGVALMFVG